MRILFLDWMRIPFLWMRILFLDGMKFFLRPGLPAGL
jgi:hypothetical protein